MRDKEKELVFNSCSATDDLMLPGLGAGTMSLVLCHTGLSLWLSIFKLQGEMSSSFTRLKIHR